MIRLLAVTGAMLLVAGAGLYLASGGAMADVGEVGIDTDPTGNEAAVLGAIDECIEVAAGDSFEVDIYAEDAEQIISFTASIRYDPAIVEVESRDVEFFLTTADVVSVQDFSDNTPDADGRYEVNAVNLSEPSVGATGSGVLARITLTAVGPGITELDLLDEDINEDGTLDRGVQLRDEEATFVGDDDGDTFYDGARRNAAVAVDADCGDADPQQTGGDDDGLDLLWIIAGIVVAVVVLGTVGALVASRRGRGSSTV